MQCIRQYCVGVNIDRLFFDKINMNSILLIASCLGVGVVDGLLYAVGGHDGPLVKKSAEVYNPTTNCWTPISEMNMSRRNAGR